MISSLANTPSLVCLSKFIPYLISSFRFMSSEEINNLAIGLNILDDAFGPRELSIQFNLAQMTNVTELETD